MGEAGYRSVVERAQMSDAIDAQNIKWFITTKFVH